MPLSRVEEEKRERQRLVAGKEEAREGERRREEKKEEDKDGGHQLEGVESISWTGKSSSGSLLADEWSDIKRGF